MATAVFFHAHPDDECLMTGGTMARLAGDGHRVVLVTATRGEHGEIMPAVVLADRESLGERRTKELQAAAAELGVSRLEFLGYVDSGMIGTPENEAPESFWQADVAEAAGRLAAVLGEENASVLVIYDDHGGYGHPDHIQVHRVGQQAAVLAGTPVVYQATVDRDRVIEMMRAGPSLEGAPDPGDFEESGFGVPAGLVTTRVDVTAQVGAKRRAIRCHPSQIAEESFFLAMPDDVFRVAFGEEQFIRHGAEPGTAETMLVLG